MLRDKVIAVFTSAWIGNKLGLLIPVLCLLTLLMVVDYISGLLAAKKEALEHPDSESYGWSSKKSIMGIYKKLGYMITILVAVCIDYLIYKFAKELGVSYRANTMFGLLVGIWFIVNEIISILENAVRMGAELPDFLKNVLSVIKKDINDKNL